MKILVVDDDELVRDLLKGILRSWGFRNLKFAASGEEALEAISEATVPFDSFILDVLMPGMNGIELCERIRSLSGYEDVPVIILTVLHDLQNIELAFSVGAFDFLTKPIARRHLHERMWLLKQLTAGKLRFGPETSGLLPKKRVQGFIEYLAMENFVKRLALCGQFNRPIYGFKTITLSQEGTAISAPDFDRIVAASAEAILNGSKQRDAFVAHAGDGVLLCVDRSASTATLERRATEVTDRFNELRSEYGIPHEIEVNICTGNAVRIGEVRSGRTALRSLELAIRSAKFTARDAILRSSGTEKSAYSAPLQGTTLL